MTAVLTYLVWAAPSLSSIDLHAHRAMSVTPSIAFWFAAAAYVVSAIGLLTVLGGHARFRKAALAAVVVALVFHGIDISWRAMYSVHPAQSIREAIGFLAFIITAGYLLASLRFRLTLGGAVVMPISLLMLLAARLTPAGSSPDDAAQLSLLGRVHISLATIGVGIFAVASVLSAIYLVEEKNLKKKRFDTMSFREAPLESLDRLSHRLIWAGFPVFTFAMVLGTMWISRLGASWGRVEYVLAAVTWAAFASVLVMRTAYGWRGRRSAKLTLTGFAAALLVLASYLLRRIF
jgi:ABC-type uncharacterized transport system permease subunit